MPALTNPRHEAFAQAIVAGLLNGDRESFSHGRAYQRVGYLTTNQNASDAAASRLLRKVKPIMARVRELQAEANARQQTKIDLSRERVGRDLDTASRLAKEQGNASAIVSSALGIAKVFHSLPNSEQSPLDFKSATNMHDIGRKLLMTVGMENPDVASIEQAIEANDAFIERLETIAAQASRTIESE